MHVRRCYDNNARGPKSGSVTWFKDGVFNANVTIIQKDSAGINAPNLIEDLDPGLYKIEKEYEDGTLEQDIIYKEEWK